MKRIILDVDVGTDDALAILFLLKAEQEGFVKIEAICCTNGNTTTEYVSKNVIRILELVGRLDIPIYKGSEEQIICPETEILQYHGIDGFGDLKYDKEPDVSIIRSEPSAIAMNNIVTKNPGEIYLVCLGPLTNIALAMKLYKNFSANIKELYLMGGNYKAVGNSTKAAEFNFHCDPESAHIVLNRSKCLISIVPWETCLLKTITLEWRLNNFAKGEHAVIQLLNKAEESLNAHEWKSLSSPWYPCDALIAIALVYPESIQKEVKCHATVELHGHETRGQIVLDHLNKEEINTRIIKRMRADFIKDILLKTSRYNFTK